MSANSTRRGFLRSAAAMPLIASAAAPSRFALGADSRTLTIAYHTALPGLDPTRDAQTSNPAVQSIYKSIFDPYIDQNPDLSLRPGILTKWGWGAERRSIVLTMRRGAVWHDGTPVTPADLVWSLERAADPKTGNPMGFVWKKLGAARINGDTVTVELKEPEPAMLKWLAFLTAYILPRKAFTQAGPERWDERPVGSGPYRVEKFERNGYIRLKAFPQYWGPKPAFETVIFKFVPDPATRVAEVESGSSDLTLEMPFEEFDRLRAKPGLVGVTTPVSDVGLLLLSNKAPLLDRNVRLAVAHAIDKKTLIDKLLRGYGTPLDTLQAPQYEAYDASIKVGFDPDKAKALLARSGYSPANPVRMKIQTTRGYKAKDYEIVQAVAGMWRKVGIEADIEVVEIARHFELQLRGELPPAAFYHWGNAIGDPSTSTGASMVGPFATWRTPEVESRVLPLLAEMDEPKRIAGYKAVDRYLAEEGIALPLLQYVQPVVHRKGLEFTPHVAGTVLPQNVRPV